MVGIDVVHVSRIENVCDMSAFIDKYFSVREKKYVFDKNGCTRAQTVAGLFAAKEAVLKAGAEFIVVLTGKIMTMPGLPKIPNSENIDIINNQIEGIF